MVQLLFVQLAILAIGALAVNDPSLTAFSFQRGK
jgi:hypothetical protein